MNNNSNKTATKLASFAIKSFLKYKISQYTNPNHKPIEQMLNDKLKELQDEMIFNLVEEAAKNVSEAQNKQFNVDNFITPNKKMTAYEIFNLDMSATEKDIKDKFKILVKEYHPDINKSPEATAKYIEIVNAYKILTAK